MTIGKNKIGVRQVEIEATVARVDPLGGTITHEVVTDGNEFMSPDYSVYLRYEWKAEWVADCSEHQFAFILAQALALKFHVNVIDNTRRSDNDGGKEKGPREAKRSSSRV